MNAPALASREIDLIRTVLKRHPEIRQARLFGSRAKGNASSRSDVDLALWGELDALRAETITAELDELPLPYRFEVQVFDLIRRDSLREHIERVGIPLLT
jgi:predicted nucleotidyltransferase